MKSPLIATYLLLQCASAAPEVIIGQNSRDNTFSTSDIPAPAINDIGAKADFRILFGKRDRNGAPLSALNDGKIPTGEDSPSANFFFTGDTDTGKLLIDLKSPINVANVATYSWHPRARAIQNYRLLGSANDGDAPELGSLDWKLLAKVDTSKQAPGQHSVLIQGQDGAALGKFRHLLMEIEKSPTDQRFNATFFSEIDVVEAGKPVPKRIKKAPKVLKEFKSKHGDFTYTLDATQAPDLVDWCSQKLIPVLDEWYPKLIRMLPVKGIAPAKHVTFTLKDPATMPANIRGVPAYASGDSVVFNIDFIRKEQAGEAIGAGIHEIVHVVQFAGTDKNGRRTRGKPIPTWVTEGAADYIRWFLFEPESKGAEITKRNFSRASYDSSYRITANFMKYVIENHEPDLMRKINESIHTGYRADLWEEWTGKPMRALGKEWKEMHRKRLGIAE